jgi:calcineurin-like phosphoesterase family protein
MKIYLTTDTHFFHDKMVQYCGRPQNHTELIGGYLLGMNLTSEDILIHLGDVSMGHDQEAHDLYIKPLKCKKWLLLGNHDKKSMSWYIANGWDWVGESMYQNLFGKKILFSHIPVKWDHVYDLNIHGHFHNSDHRKHEPELVKISNRWQKLLAIEYTNYQPVLLEDFIREGVK